MEKIRLHLQEKMTPWERKTAFERGEKTDRIIAVPFMSEIKCLLTGETVYDWWHNTDVMVDVEIQLFNRFGYDRLTLGPNTRGITEALGGVFVYSKNQTPHMEEFFLKDYVQLANIEPEKVGSHPRIQVFLEAIEKLLREAGEIVPIEASIGGPFTIASNLRGTEIMLRDCRRQPEQIQKMMRIITDAQKSVIDAIAKYERVGIAMADPVANPMLIGPKMYEKYVFPYTKEITEYAYAKTGQKVSLHMCGKTDSIWKYFAQYSLNEVSLDNIVDLEKAAIELGEHVTIAGNVDPVGIVLNGNKEEIFEDVRRCIESGRKSKCGFHLTTGCDIPEKTKAEKIEWFMDAARYYT